MKKTFALKHPKIDGDILLTYKYDLLWHYSVDAEDVDPLLLKGFLARIPRSLNDLELFKQDKKLYLREVPQELTFELFWEKYDLKIGDKKRACKLWEALKLTEKQQAIDHIPKYNRMLSDTNVNKKYPETYLSKRQFITS